MGLFVSTVSADVGLPRLGLVLVHPTTNYDLGSQFSGEDFKRASDLTAAIQGGTLTWKKTSAGATELAADYDPDWVDTERLNTGPGATADRAVTFKDLTSSIAINASPGFTWGRSGNTPAGSYLQNDTVPSNVSGRLVPVSDGLIKTVFVSQKTATSCTVVVQKRTGSVFTDLATVTLTTQRVKVLDISPPIAVAYADEIVVKVGSGSPSDPVVGLMIKGTVPP